jgi:cyclopropane fatty-acyl-phospholipid synthase-like methyltransferase
MSRNPDELKSMPLYRDVDRVYNELAALGLKNDDKLCVDDLAAFDQYHYHGTVAVDAAIKSLGIGTDDRVLEIGSGIGGPARHIAAMTGANVVALELQPDLNDLAKELTHRCGLSGRVEHACADVLDYSPDDNEFSAIVSWLALFHIDQRDRLLSRCMAWLQTSGRLFIEDLYARGNPTPVEQEDLAATLYCRYLPDRNTYESDFRRAGFSDLKIDDMSEDWQQFTHQRYLAFCDDRPRHQRLHGEVIVDGLERFYATVDRLFSGGNLGGLRLIGRKQHASRE